MELKNKTIAIIIPDFDHGGEEKRAVFFANNYIKQFKKVYIIAPSGKSDHLLNAEVERHVIHVRSYKNLPKVIQFLRKNKIDYLQGHKRATIPYLYFAEKFLGIHSNFNFDNIYLSGNGLYKYISPKHLLYLSDVLKDFYQNYYPKSENQTINMGGDFYQTLPQDKIKDKRRALGVEDKQMVLLSLGRLSEQKNHHLLLQTLSRIKRFNWVCLVAGSGPLEEELKTKAKELGIDQKVKFLGHRTDVELLLNVSDIVVQSSIFEGFPNILIEAASIGLPVIASDVGSTKSLVKENGILYPSQDSEALKDALEKMLNNLESYKNEALLFKESDYFKQFHKSKMLQNYIEYYQNHEIKK